MILDDRTAEFVQWCTGFEQRFADALVDALALGAVDLTLATPDAVALGPAGLRRVEPSVGASAAVPDPVASVLRSAQLALWLERSTRPTIARIREALALAQQRLVAPGYVARWQQELRDRVDALPLRIELDPTIPGSEGGRRREAPVEVPLRAWLEVAVRRPYDAALAQVHTAAVAELDAATAELEQLDKVVEYYVVAVQRQGADPDQRQLAREFAEAGLERTRALLQQFRSAREAGAQRVVGELRRACAVALDDALAPLRAHRPAELERSLRAAKQRELAAKAPPGLLRRASAGLTAAWSSAVPWLREIAAELRALVAEVPPEDHAWHELLRAPLASRGEALPLAYRRLFAAVPFELADVYVPRNDVEQQCDAALQAWLDGRPYSLLIHGDRGAGKRTMLNQVLARVRQDVPVRWVRLAHDMQREADVVAAVARELDDVEANSFAELGRMLAQSTDRRVMVVENCERLFRRTPDGVADMLAFLDAVAASGESTLWLLLMASPAAELLGSVLQLPRRVTRMVHVEPMSSAEIRALIEQRHRRSGFGVSYAAPRPGALERLRHPWSTTAASRDPAGAFFARLAASAAGNPRQALYYWLSRTRLDAEGHAIVAECLPPHHGPLLARLELVQRLVLAALAQSGSLTLEELAMTLRGHDQTLASELQLLQTLGLVVPRDGTHWSLGPVYAHPVTLELRALNMI